MRRLLRAGKYNRRVSIERVTDPADDSGGQEEVWTETGRAWVEATPVGGKESLVAGSLMDSQGWRIETFWRSDITTVDRLAADWLPSVKHRIMIESAVDPDGRREKLLIFGLAVLAHDLADPVEN